MRLVRTGHSRGRKYLKTVLERVLFMKQNEKDTLFFCAKKYYLSLDGLDSRNGEMQIVFRNWIWYNSLCAARQIGMGAKL